eukprot:UN16755
MRVLIDIERGSIMAHFADICYMVFSSILFVKTSLLGLVMLIISEFTSSFVKVHYLRDSFEFDIRNCTFEIKRFTREEVAEKLLLKKKNSSKSHKRNR